ncbi:MAG: aminoacetone oxidase family FAD-binding enzyme, partial [Silvibacterium sp.]|nr:aminoacetone oxidase family FAD-binding enzyme [Silvibacterium sp.]
MCAIEAGRRGRRVAILERASRPGKKILISGGGRCNFTNIHCRPENFLSENPHFAKSALARYMPADFLTLVEKRSIPWHEKKLGQLFCDRASSDILNMLLAEASEAGVTLLCDTHITEVRRDDIFHVHTASSEFRATVLVVATGGLSIPKMGATGLGYDLARQFGLKIVEPRPALVPFVLAPADQERLCDLSGVATRVLASIGRRSFDESMLITHRGLSGPAILQISSYWREGTAVTLDLAPEQHLGLNSSSGRRDLPTLRSHLRTIFPQRLADRLLDLDPPAGFTKHALAAWEHRWHRWPLTPETTEGYDKAEV